MKRSMIMMMGVCVMLCGCGNYPQQEWVKEQLDQISKQSDTA